MPSAALALAFSLLLAAPSREPLKLASPGFTGVDISDAQATFFSDHLAQQLNLRGLQVVTSSQIGALLGFDRQRQLLGCKDADDSCMAELAAALGVDGVITGSIGKFDQTFQVNVSVVSPKDGRTLSAFSRKVNGSSAVLDALNEAATQLARELPAKLGVSSDTKIITVPIGKMPTTPPSPELAPPNTGGLRDWFWAPAGAGLIAGAGATVMFLLASGDAGQLQRAAAQPQQYPLTQQRALQLQDEGRTYATAGYVLTAAGVAGLGAGAVLYFLVGAPQPQALHIVPGPAGVAITGAFP